MLSSMASSTASIFPITRLLEHLNETNAKTRKQLLMKQLGCSNETPVPSASLSQGQAHF